MKLLKTGLFCLLLFLCGARAAAQLVPHANAVVPKPELFRDMPKRMDVNTHVLAPLLQKEEGETVSIQLTSGFIFKGVVVSKSPAAETRYKTVVLKSTNRPGAAFTITGVRKSDGRYQYSGRMLSLKHSDAYEMVEESGRFALQKRVLSDLVSE